MPGRGTTWPYLRMAAWYWGVVLMLCLVGCTGPQDKGPEILCPGKATVQEALSALRSHASQVGPMRASGRCRLGYIDDKGEKGKHEFPVKLFLEPPYNVYMHGTPGVGPGGVVSLGSNREEFWLSIKPEINTLYWGVWKEASPGSHRLVNPRVVMEAMGLVDFQDSNRWRLENRDGYDILSEVDASGALFKQIFVNPCDDLVDRIVYLDEFGATTVTVDLKEYIKLNQTFSLPTRVHIINYVGGQEMDSLRLSLARDGFQEKEFSDKQRARMFTRPKDGGYDLVEDVNKTNRSPED